MNIGYLLAVAGALGSGTGSVLESVAVRRSGAYGGDNDDLSKIARQPLYWLGVGIDILSFGFAAAALHRLPLFLVQTVMAFSVGVTATISAFLGLRLGRKGWWALAFSVGGLVLLGLSAQPGPAAQLPPGWRWILLAVSVPVALTGYFANRTHQRWTAPVLAFAAGIGFTAVAVSARTLHVDPSLAGWLREPAIWAIVLNGVVATATFAMALQKGNATTVSAVMFATNTVVPSVIGLTLLHDSIRPGWALPATIGFLVAVLGSITLAHFSARAEREQRATDPHASEGALTVAD